ncbi:hypothetical protein [Neisseria mucosa]|nr:hypothetical protein [Neisseria mucosa]
MAGSVCVGWLCVLLGLGMFQTTYGLRLLFFFMYSGLTLNQYGVASP